ncbi:IQ calmodulin-binding motif protein (macronuclear) [Tetrahymena thermophila SB210]|uniref:IQ calmodulin-binding motif protein n=1 Tax=Tetrahymena thermophila (strain SB210) TaxID=312017 RepID=I7MJ14_TETTS|nr:IQ calmodulin-binding motif protein [Tetrahymena thermophila SB210]EAS04950.1 IQ calmodulin-binding motif protein [Tetrahymena thermophila SB210]|eukprot:XP_001025195.1 IQ calmodulin-binding motif protein [Tetrahymena thermophila SB210]
MGSCQSDCRDKQEIDPYNVPKEQEPLKLEDAESQQKIIKIQSFARGYKAKQEVQELKKQVNSNAPPREVALPYEGPMATDKLQVQKILNDKFNWPARPEFKEFIRLPPFKFIQSGAIYKGQWNNGLRHGRGIQFWPDGSVYQGDWVEDMADGKGRLIHPDGDYYQGDWQKDRAQGIGIFVHVDGNKYEGEWYQDKQHGQGVEEQQDFIYRGSFQNGLKHGKGKIIWKNDGTSYEGDFYEGLMEGTGRFIFQNGKIYNGQWFKSKMHGHGELIYPDGRKYTGSFVEGQKNGLGKMEYPDGKIYEGEWKNGKQHGQGQVTTPDGRIGQGYWEEGKRVKNYDQMNQQHQEVGL